MRVNKGRDYIMHNRLHIRNNVISNDMFVGTHFTFTFTHFTFTHVHVHTCTLVLI